MTIEDEPPEFERSLQLSCERLRRRVDEQKDRAEAALAACAEMRAALIHIRERAASAIGEDESDAIDICNAIERLVGSALGEGDPLTGDLPRHSDLARTDLGRGMVAVPRGVVERWRERLSTVLCCLHSTDHQAREMIVDARADLNALLDGGKGR